MIKNTGDNGHKMNEKAVLAELTAEARIAQDIADRKEFENVRGVRIGQEFPSDTTKQPTFDKLREALDKQGGGYDYDAIEKAFNAGMDAHKGQFRLSGEPYFWHPVSVAKIVISLGMDTESIEAALLHDAVEDTSMTCEDVKREFGENVALLVDGVTKLGRVSTASREKQQAENVRKMLLAMAQDIRVIIIKLADRLHNMRTISAQSPQKQLEKSLETLEIYAPIAHRLGIRAVKEELEDLAIRYLDPIAYCEIRDKLEENRQDRHYFIESIKKRIGDRIGDSIPNVLIEGRVKSVHGIYRKMFMQGKQFEEIYDVYAVRVIVNTVNDCYNVLGLVHEMFRPIPGRFKDYISTPKPNMYQSLHTTVLSKEGLPFEVQIRTWQMHYTAEYGIAAHWKYKSGVSSHDEKFEERLAWIRQLLESQKETDDVEEIVRTIKTDLAPEDVFGVTPHGEVISLPVGSTVIDFAYAIHSAIGNRMVGAKVDGRIVPIDYKISTGDVIEIITTSQPGHGPSRDWLKIVKTSGARNKIRSWFKKERREENIVTGRAEVAKSLRQSGIKIADDELDSFLTELSEKQACATVQDFYAKVGYGGIQFSNLLPSIKEKFRQRSGQYVEKDIASAIKPNNSKPSNDGVIVEGIDNCLVKLSHCCSPLPGDPIIGFITRGHGVSIHKRDCINVPQDISKAQEPDRWIGAHWSQKRTSSFNATIQVLTFDRENLLADVTVAIANMRVMIHAINARQMKNGNYEVNITVRVESLEHLKSIIAKLSSLAGVYSVERQVG